MPRRWIQHPPRRAQRPAAVRGDTAGAVRALTEAAQLLPAGGFCGDHVPVWHDLARAQQQAGYAAEAVRTLRRVVSASSERACWPISYVRSFFLLCQIEAVAGRTDEAARAYGQFLDFWGKADFAALERQQSHTFLDARASPGAGAARPGEPQGGR